MSQLTADTDRLDELMESLEQEEAERTLHSLQTGDPFDAGVVEGISIGIDKLDAAKTGLQLGQVMQELLQTSHSFDDEYVSDDAYAKGIAAGANHVAGIVRDELSAMPDQDF